MMACGEDKSFLLNTTSFQVFQFVHMAPAQMNRVTFFSSNSFQQLWKELYTTGW
jgi:hypothetical protein